jgi:hypothetical protein
VENSFSPEDFGGGAAPAAVGNPFSATDFSAASSGADPWQRIGNSILERNALTGETRPIAIPGGVQAAGAGAPAPDATGQTLSGMLGMAKLTPYELMALSAGPLMETASRWKQAAISRLPEAIQPATRAVTFSVGDFLPQHGQGSPDQPSVSEDIRAQFEAERQKVIGSTGPTLASAALHAGAAALGQAPTLLGQGAMLAPGIGAANALAQPATTLGRAAVGAATGAAAAEAQQGLSGGGWTPSWQTLAMAGMGGLHGLAGPRPATTPVAARALEAMQSEDGQTLAALERAAGREPPVPTQLPAAGGEVPPAGPPFPTWRDPAELAETRALGQGAPVPPSREAYRAEGAPQPPPGTPPAPEAGKTSFSGPWKPVPEPGGNPWFTTSEPYTHQWQDFDATIGRVPPRVAYVDAPPSVMADAIGGRFADQSQVQLGPDLYGKARLLTAETPPSPPGSIRLFRGVSAEEAAKIEGAPGRGEGIAVPPDESGAVPLRGAPRSQVYQDAFGIRYGHETTTDLANWFAAQREKTLAGEVADPKLRQDMYFAMQGARNPLVDAPGTDPIAVEQRIAAHPQGAAAMRAMAQDRAYFDAARDKINDLGGGLDYRPGWLHLTYDRPETGGEVVSGGGMVAPETSMMKERAFPNAAAAMDAGFTPRTTDYAQSVRESMEEIGRTLAKQRMIQDVARFPAETAEGQPTIVRGSPLEPPGPHYVKVEPGARPSPLLLRALSQRDAETGVGPTARPAPVGAEALPPQLRALYGVGDPAADGNTVWMHPDLWSNLKPVLMDGDYGNAYDRVLSFSKGANTLMGLFHQVSLTEANIRALGLRQGLATSARQGFGVPGLSQYLQNRLGPAITPEMAERAIRGTVKLGAPESDIEATAFRDLMQRLETWGGGREGAGALVGRPVALGAKFLEATQRAFQAPLWDYHAQSKVIAFNTIADRWERFRAGDDSALTMPERARLTPGMADTIRQMPEEDFLRSIGEHVNDQYGHQNWKLLDNATLSNPNFWKWARRVEFSPDWNISAIRGSLSPLSTNPVRSALGVNALANTVKLYGLLNAVNYAGSGHAMWSNPAGRQLSVQVGHDEEHPIWFRGLKHEQEAPELFGVGDWPDYLPLGKDIGGAVSAFRNPGQPGYSRIPGGSAAYFLARKTTPMLAGGIAATAGRYPSYYPSLFEKMAEDAARRREIPNRYVDAFTRLLALAGGFTSFGASQLLNKYEEPVDGAAMTRDLLRGLSFAPVQEKPGREWKEQGFGQSLQNRSMMKALKPLHTLASVGTGTAEENP